METKENKQYLFDTSSWLDNIKDEGYYEEFLECREDTDEILDEDETPDMDSQEFMEWAIENSHEEVEDFFMNMKYSEYDDCRNKCVITGALGLWDGKKQIIPVFCDSITEAVEKCISDMDDVDAWINHDTNCIEVNGHHHDGTNCFEIRVLSKAGYDRLYENWWDDIEKGPEDMPDLKDETLYGILPEFLY